MTCNARSFRRSPPCICTHLCLLLFVMAASFCSSSAFLHSPTWACSFGSTQLQRSNFNLKWQRTGAKHMRGATGRMGSLCLFSSSSDSASIDGKIEQQICPTSYIVSYDGAIANNARARCKLCLGVALNTWPSLCDTIGAENTNDLTIDDVEQWAWVLNKMEALVPSMSNDGTDVDGGLSVMVDLVMLARLILEEQRLDAGRNSGRGGKYGGKYHPQQEEEKMASSSAEEADAGSSKSSTPVGSRPLTVGEIASNWLNGGHLRDTVRIKYNIEKKDPFPIVREHIRKALSNTRTDDDLMRTSNMSPGANMQLRNLMKTSDDAVILLDHECRKGDALHFIKDTGMSCEIIAPLVNESELDVLKSLVLKTGEYESDIPKRICIIHNSLSLLRHLKILNGGDSPRLQGGYAKIPNTSVEIGLFLPAWSDCTSPQQEIDAIMDPWLNVMTEDDLARLSESQAAMNAWE